MYISIVDPMTGNEVINLDIYPIVIEGKGRDVLKMIFESEYSKDEYLLFDAENADPRVSDC